MKNKLKLKGKLKTYLEMPLILGFILALLDIWIFSIDFEAGILLAVFTFFYLVIIIVTMTFTKPGLINELVTFATEYGQIQKQLLKELELPHALLDETGKLIWSNQAFDALVGMEKLYKKSITTLFPELKKEGIA